MSADKRDIKELKLTAAVYATQKDWVQHLKDTGRMPEISNPRPWLLGVMNHIIQKRGSDIALNPDEQLMYDAIVSEGRLPGGSVILVPDSDD